MGRLIVGALAATLLGPGVAALQAQQVPPQGPAKGPELPLRPQYERGQPVSPIFEGYYENPDGTWSLSFGFFNRNSEEDLELALGPSNFIEPAEFDGLQPTYFPTETNSGYIGRDFGVFTVVVPADFEGDVVWSLTSKGVTHTVPGRVGIEPYHLAAVDQPMGVGSLPPRVKLSADGPEAMGPTGIVAEDALTTSVGEPVEVGAWAADNFDPQVRESVPVEVQWFKHQGPVGSSVTFSMAEAEVEAAGGWATTTATFSHPGAYMLRARVANFDSRDSDGDDQCCWTSGFVRVDVTE